MRLGVVFVAHRGVAQGEYEEFLEGHAVRRVVEAGAHSFGALPAALLLLGGPLLAVASAHASAVWPKGPTRSRRHAKRLRIRSNKVKVSVHEPVLNVKGAVGALSPTVTGEKNAVINGGGLTDEGVIDGSPDDIEAGQSIAKLARPCRIEPTIFRECRGQYRTRLTRTKAQWKWQPGQDGVCLEHGMPC